ncbi:MAG: c-type cytochrome [Solirubrobacteraceae bacterium]
MARRASTAACLAAAALLASGCGSAGIEVAKSDPDYDGAVLFAENCGGCHTLSKAGTHGSAEKVRKRERTDGPNLDKRQEDEQDVLFAIANGGFSGAIMPENIVTGPDADAVARFLAKYSGSQSKDSSGG